MTEALADEAAEGQLVVIETTVLDIDRGEPATAHVRASLEGLAHVVTTNKGPAAFAYDELEALAESVDRVFFFEGAVMDGVPVFNLVRETMPAVVVEGFRGVINTTCQYMLSQMERGVPLDDADRRDAGARDRRGGSVARHRRLGRRGEDGGAGQRADGRARSRRTTSRARASATSHEREVARGARARPADPAGGVGVAARRPARGARRAGDARSRRSAGRRWAPRKTRLYLHTDLLGDVGIVQRTSSVTQTAYALLSDLTQISRRLREL